MQCEERSRLAVAPTNRLLCACVAGAGVVTRCACVLSGGETGRARTGNGGGKGPVMSYGQNGGSRPTKPGADYDGVRKSRWKTRHFCHSPGTSEVPYRGTAASASPGPCAPARACRRARAGPAGPPDSRRRCASETATRIEVRVHPNPRRAPEALILTDAAAGCARHEPAPGRRVRVATWNRRLTSRRRTTR